MLLNLNINEVKSDKSDKKDKKRNLSGKTTTVIIFLGRKDKVTTSHIVCAIVEETSLNAKQIGKIKVEIIQQ
jgi:hypothetical protein